MRAIVCEQYGPPEDLVLQELPDPTVAPGTVVVRVRAAAVNFPDVLLIDGKYQLKIPAPFTPGSELAGDVIGGAALAEQGMAATGDDAWSRSKAALARVFAGQVLSQAPGLADAIAEGAADLEALTPEAIGS